MASQSKIDDIQQRVRVCEDYAKLWDEFFRYFGTPDFHDRRILDQDEARFAKLVTTLAKQQFSLSYFVGDKFSDGDKIIDILMQAESLKHLQQLNDANFSKFEIDWHSVFINMHRAVGRLERELPPEEPEEETNGKKGKKGKKVQKAKGPAMPKPAAPKLGASAAPRLGAPKGPGGPPRPPKMG